MDALRSQLESAATLSPPRRLTSSQRARMISSAESFVKTAFAAHDPSHDWHHVHRVRLLALHLSRSPELSSSPLDLLVIELGALFHDLTDAKYTSSSLTPSSVLAPFWAQSGSTISAEQRALVEKIVGNVSWSKDVRRRFTHPSHQSASDIDLQKWLESCREFWCVSDADRLDSIGSIGIMRCAAYSAKVSRPLYIPPNNPAMDPVPPAEQAEGYNGSAVGHFYEKLLKIKGDRLYTEAAREEAERRQRAMQGFLQELDLEWLVAQQGAEMAVMEMEEGLAEDEDEDEGEDEEQ